MNSSEIKAALLQYYRYDKQYIIVALESQHFHNADVVTVDGQGRVIEIEVKISIADMKKDIKKPKHYTMRRDYLKNHQGDEPLLHEFQWQCEEGTGGITQYSGSRFYFAVPESLRDEASDVCNSYYPYAGLILVTPQPRTFSLAMFGIWFFKEAYDFHTPKASISVIKALLKDMSATLTRLASENCQRQTDRVYPEGMVTR